MSDTTDKTPELNDDQLEEAAGGCIMPDPTIGGGTVKDPGPVFDPFPPIYSPTFPTYDV